MPRRRIGQETFGFEKRETVTALDELSSLIDWAPVEAALEALPVARRGEAAWPALALFRALLIAVWHDLSDVKLADPPQGVSAHMAPQVPRRRGQP